MQTRFGRYSVVGPLARGGMAEVLLGRLEGPGGFLRPVVIKRILPLYAKNRAFVEMFLDEARIAASIRHPNIVHVEDLGLEDGEPYIVMEYLAGESVAALLDRARANGQQLEPRLVVHLVCEILAGLHAAHTLVGLDGQPKGIVHRDVSPQNVMLSFDGHVKVLDFGIARADNRLAKTSTGEVKGKVAYISPEQCSGENIDSASDVFSVGVMLYELATLRHPFKQADEAATLMALLSSDYYPLEKARADLPRGLDEVIARSMMAQKSKRYASAGEMRRDLLKIARDLQGDEPPEAMLAAQLRTLFMDRISDKARIAAEVASGRDPAETMPETASAKSSAAPTPGPERQVGRYAVHELIGSGGMAEVHYGTMRAEGGISRPVAIKKLHPSLIEETEARAILLDEARLVARVHHPNVVQLLDVVIEGRDLFLVLEYVHGETLASLLRSAKGPIDPSVAVGIVTGVLEGLHAAHSATDTEGNLLGIVHRDVSPQNVMVGTDGMARVLDFGIAKAQGRAQQATQTGLIKGKLAYMAPEQLRTGIASERSDVFSSAAVLWELLTAKRLFDGEADMTVRAQVLTMQIPSLASIVAVPPALDQVMQKALARDPAERFESARAFAAALERSLTPASSRAVAEWLESLASADLVRQAEMVRRFSQGARTGGIESPPIVEGETAHNRVALSIDTSANAAKIDTDVFGSARRTRRAAATVAFVVVLGAGIALLAGLRYESSPSPVLAAPSSNPIDPPPSVANTTVVAPTGEPGGSSLSAPPPSAVRSAEPPVTARVGQGARPIRPQKTVPTTAASSTPNCRLVRSTDARGIITFERVCN